MFAIVWEYRGRFGRVLAGLATERAAQRFALNLLVAFAPAAVLGLAFGRLIKTYLFHAVPVALAFIVGAIIILWVERRRHAPVIQSVDEMTWPDALKIGIAQAFALIPGTSRSGATIIGGMLFGLSRTAATEFSFFLAIPTLLAATGYEFVRNRHLLAGGDLTMVGVGFVTAFVSAFFVVRALLRYVAHHDFVPFAWYRIAFGLVILGTGYTGLVQWS